jgi:hypothetical protein
MSATIILAKQESTDRILHINYVETNRIGFSCVGCSKEMVVVKSEARKKDWHFRHKDVTECNGRRDKALHDFAVQLLMENTEVAISEELQIVYNDPRKEVALLGKRSDVTVKYGDDEDVHFEVFVTHDLDKEKVDLYRNKKVKCVKIDLSNPDLLTAQPENIKDAVLKQTKNKTVVYWEDEKQIETVQPASSDSVNGNNNSWLYLILLFLGASFIYNLFTGAKRKKSKKSAFQKKRLR